MKNKFPTDPMTVEFRYKNNPEEFDFHKNIFLSSKKEFCNNLRKIAPFISPSPKQPEPNFKERELNIELDSLLITSFMF